MKQLITNVSVFDGVNEKLIEHASIVIEKNLVSKIVTENISRENFDTVIDGKNTTAIPGLTDCHVHFSISKLPHELDTMCIDEAAIRAAKNAEETLMRGFTTVRDAGSLVFGLKKCIDEGYVAGPRIFPSHGAITQTAGHGDSRSSRAQKHTVFGSESPFMKTGAMVIADGVSEVLRAVREQLFLGASQIKIMAGGGIGSLYDPLESTQFTLEEMHAAVDAAKDFGTYVFAHIYTPKAMRRAAEAGVLCFEHAALLDEESARIIKDKGIWLDPQFAFHLDGFCDKIIKSPESLQKLRRVRPAIEKQAELINKFSLPTIYGTDLAMDKYLSEEFQLTEFRAKKNIHGSFEAVKTATGNVRELFKLCTFRNPYAEGKIGVLEQGAFADVLLIEGNPVQDAEILTDTRSIKLIMKDGKIYKNSLECVA